MAPYRGQRSKPKSVCGHGAPTSKEKSTDGIPTMIEHRGLR